MEENKIQSRAPGWICFYTTFEMRDILRLYLSEIKHNFAIRCGKSAEVYTYWFVTCCHSNKGVNAFNRTIRHSKLPGEIRLINISFENLIGIDGFLECY